jgi:hypothetical protein
MMTKPKKTTFCIFSWLTITVWRPTWSKNSTRFLGKFFLFFILRVFFFSPPHFPPLFFFFFCLSKIRRCAQCDCESVLRFLRRRTIRSSCW